MSNIKVSKIPDATLQSERKLKDQIVKNETLMNERVKTELVLKKFKSKRQSKDRLQNFYFFQGARRKKTSKGK